VSGETWLVIIPDPQADSFADDRWVALSSEEVKAQRGKIKATIDGEDIEIPEPVNGQEGPADDPVAIRIWDPSPRRHWEATSPVRASLGVLAELQLLTAAVAAIARSRITGRGVLLVPAGTRFPGAPGEAGSEDSLLDIFVEVASTAIREPESAAATVPIVLEVPGDLINGVKWLEFASEFDSLALQLREEAIRRFAAGADIPAEVLLGMGDMNHWGAWAVTAEALRMGAEPRLGLICNALTEQWLRPLLEAENDRDADQWIVWYDTSSLRTSSNKAASALDAFREGIIGGPAARRELGFSEGDAPETGSVAPADATATPAGTDVLPVSETQAAPATDVALAASADATAVATSGAASPDGAPDSRHAALVAAVDGLVYAALCAAGGKILRTPACARMYRADAMALVARAEVHVNHPVPDIADVYAWKLVEGAWARVPEIAGRYGVDDILLSEALDTYTMTLIMHGEPHTYDNTVRLLAQHGLIPATIIGMVKQ
jgi:hypothetical protein